MTFPADESVLTRILAGSLMLLAVLLIAGALAFGICLVVIACKGHPPVLQSRHRLYLASAFLPMFLNIVVPPAMTLVFNWDIRQNAVFTKLGMGLGA